MSEAAAKPAALAGDDGAPVDVAEPGQNPIGLYFRHVVQERLRLLFPRGAHVLHLEGKTGEDPLALASLGGSVRFEVRAAEDLGSIHGMFDGAFVNLGARDGEGLPRLGRFLSSRLRSGAPVAFHVIGRWPLPGLASQRLRDGLGPGFSWRSVAALGVLVPSPAHEDWARSHPMAFGVLAALERLVREWPGARECGDRLLVEGARD